MVTNLILKTKRSYLSSYSLKYNYYRKKEDFIMLTVAYVGFGVSVREYHIPYVEKRDDIKIKYVFRREEDIEAFKDYEPFYSDITFTTNFDDVLNDPEIDLVVISAPDKFHVSYASQVLNANKHCLVEKPFAPTSAEAKEVFELAKSKNLICMPNQNRRFDADFMAVKEVIASGKLGEIVRFESHYDYYKPNGWNKLPALYNLGVHTTDQVISLFGKPDRVDLDARSLHNEGTDDYFDLNLFYGKCKATISTCMSVLIDYPRFTVHCTKGSLTLPPAIHGSSKAKVVNRHVIEFKDASEDRYGTLVYMNENNEKITEKVPVSYNHYEYIYDSLIKAINKQEEKCVKDDEVITVLQILEEATIVANNAKY